ncbi:unnamed protein product [Oikopleura dioica]|uniref:Uncharacterized protein n=1 Tax=Oikopleura dioica TaxID=34765 RepID=E4Z239_OIKDI|nr:unnamed protein product [Oikopleura dioica]
MLKSHWTALAMKLSMNPWPEDLVKKLESGIDVRKLSEEQWNQELIIRIRRLAKQHQYEVRLIQSGSQNGSAEDLLVHEGSYFYLKFTLGHLKHCFINSMNFRFDAEGQWHECQASSDSLQKRNWSSIETKIRRLMEFFGSKSDRTPSKIANRKRLLQECENRVNLLVPGCILRNGMSFLRVPILSSFGSAYEDLFGELSLSADSEHQYQLFFSKPILLSPSSFTQFNQAKVTDFSQPKLAKFKENLFLSEVVLARSLNFSKVQNITAILSQLATWKRVQLVIENLTKIPNSVYIAISSRGVIQFCTWGCTLELILSRTSSHDSSVKVSQYPNEFISTSNRLLIEQEYATAHNFNTINFALCDDARNFDSQRRAQKLNEIKLKSARLRQMKGTSKGYRPIAREPFDTSKTPQLLEILNR